MANNNNANRKRGYFPQQQFLNTQRYLKIKSDLPKNDKALARINDWIRNNIAGIDPAELYTCNDCGLMNGEICNCHLLKRNDKISTKALTKTDIVGKHSGWSLFSSSGLYNLNENFQDCSGFDNKHMPNSYIHSEMYNYIVINMSHRYSSFEDRDEHVRKLSLKFLELKKIDTTTLTPYQRSVFLITRQKARDQYEVEVLGKENRPGRTTIFGTIYNFVRACLLTILSILLIICRGIYQMTVAILPIISVLVQLGFIALSVVQIVNYYR